jgi:nucleotide-binding universal stress UspA family protein
MFTKILIGCDGSPQADRAFGVALDIAQRYSASVIALSVVRPPEFAETVETTTLIERATEQYEESFGDLKQRAADAEVPLACEVRVGHPADWVVRLARDRGVELIIVGHRGKSRVEEWLLGSVSKRVLSYAPCNVLVVR